MINDCLYEDPDLASFYDVENGWSPDLSFCLSLAAGCSSMLDLGCGTGRLAAAIAAESCDTVFGVDPAGAMLDIARGRPGGQFVTWVQADGRSLRLGRRFDLIVMTGHTFQVFLTAEDRLAVLRTIAAHLMPDGRCIFDSRNPEAAEWHEWTPTKSIRRINHPSLGPADSWNDVSQDPVTDIVSYGTYYRIDADGRELSSRSRISFPSRAELDQLMEFAGLSVEAWLGDWTGTSCEQGSPELIPLGRLGVMYQEAVS